MHYDTIICKINIILNKNTRVFWFHYNKPASLKFGKPKITIHYGGVCHIADNVICNVSTYGHLKKDQPKFVIKGRCSSLRITNGIAYID